MIRKKLPKNFRILIFFISVVTITDADGGSVSICKFDGAVIFFCLREFFGAQCAKIAEARTNVSQGVMERLHVIPCDVCVQLGVRHSSSRPYFFTSLTWGADSYENMSVNLSQFK